MSKCTCNSFRFELKEASPENSRYKFYFIQCALCGNPIGVTDYYHTHTAIEAMKKEIESKIRNIESSLVNIEHSLRAITNKQ